MKIVKQQQTENSSLLLGSIHVSNAGIVLHAQSKEQYFSFKTTVFDKNLYTVPGFGTLINYVVKHCLYNKTLQFVVSASQTGKEENVNIIGK